LTEREHGATLPIAMGRPAIPPRTHETSWRTEFFIRHLTRLL
jgi:hypothetical protein